MATPNLPLCGPKGGAMWLPSGTLMAILHACRWAVPYGMWLPKACMQVGGAIYGMWLPKGAHRLVFEAHRPLVLSIREGGEQLRVVAARLDISLLGKARCNQSAIRLISEAHQRGSSEKAI